MAERASGRRAARTAADNASSGFSTRLRDFLRAAVERLGAAGPLGVLVLLLGAGGAILLIVTEFSTVVEVEALTASCEYLGSGDPEVADDCVKTGGEQHAYALLLLGLVGLLMAWGAGVGRSRPAAAALGAIGVVALVIALVGDVPELDETGAVGERFTEAEAGPGRGLWTELTGGALAVVAGILALRMRRPE